VPERSTINQTTQVGVESTSGTSVAANKLLTALNFSFGIEADSKSYRASGRKYSSIVVENKEWSSGSMDGPVDFNAIIYALSGVMGSVSPVANGASATAKNWIFTPPVSGNASPKTYTFEQGDSVRAQKFSYGLFTGFGYKGTRDEFTMTGDLIGQLTTDGITKTASPTAIALAPSSANQWNVWMDSTSGALGTTQLTRPVSVEFSMSDVYGPAWFINRSVTSWVTHIDKAPSCTFKMMVEADAAGMGPLTDLRAGSTKYIRVESQGAQIASDGPGAIYNVFKHDMALKFMKPSKWEDSDGIFAITWECELVEDSAWGSGKAQELTITNLITAL
jgi:hypothetical protein